MTYRRLAFFLAIALALAIGASSAKSTLSQCNKNLTAPVYLQNNELMMIEPALLALIISFDVVAVGYILSRLLPLTNIRGWLTSEYWEIAKSAMLIVSIYSVITFLSSTALLLSGTAAPGGIIANPVGNLVYHTEVYLCNVDSNVSASIQNLTGFFLAEGVLKSITIEYGVPIPLGLIPDLEELPTITTGVTLPFYSNFLIDSNFIYHGQFTSIYNDMITFLLFPLKVFNESEILLLPILVEIALAMLIPTGLFMRAFPFTRNAGGTLIGFGVGIAVIWPSTLLLINAPISSYFYNTVLGGMPSSSAQPVTYPTSSSGSFISYAWNYLIDPFRNMVTISNDLWLAFSTINSIYPSLNAIMDMSIYSILQLYILLIIDILVAYTLTDSVARMLGGTIRLRLGGKLKLV